MTEDVHNHEESVQFFISNVVEMAYIHYITLFKRQKKAYFVTSDPRSGDFFVLIQV